MTGRISLFMVLGMSLLMITLNSGRNTNDAVDNFVTYESRSIVDVLAANAAKVDQPSQ